MKVKNCEIKHCYISTLFNILAVHIKSQNHGVSALKSVKLQSTTKTAKWELKKLKQVLLKKSSSLDAFTKCFVIP